MLELIPKIALYNISHRFGFPKMMPINYTVSLTYQCNSRCSTCNIYTKKSEQMDVAEYDKIFRHIGNSPYWVTLSGGEPFLRKDIADITKVIYKNSKPAIINIPSNGILTDTIVDKVDLIAKSCPKSQVIINLSIDGIAEQHDRIRNIPDNYKKVIATYNKLRNLPHPNLSVGIHTVISRFNVESFTSIANHLMQLQPDQYITEIAEERNELLTMGTNITPNIISYKAAIDYLIHRIKNQKITKRVNRITQAFRIEYYNLVKKVLRDKKQIIPCYSGLASVQIAPDGEIWSCCIKAKALGNLRDSNYDLKKIWFTEQLDKERRSIHNKECHCPLANASYTNMLMDIPTLLRVFYRSFIQWWT